MAELADALDLGSSVYDMQVQVLSSAFKVVISGMLGVAVFFCTSISPNISGSGSL